MKKELFSNVLSLVWNLLLVYVCYTLKCTENSCQFED